MREQPTQCPLDTVNDVRFTCRTGRGPAKSCPV